MLVSRIGKQPITIPQGVQTSVEGNTVTVSGPKGVLRRMVNPEIRAEVRDGLLCASPAFRTKRTPALWGLERMLLANMVRGVTEGYEKKLELEGVGYRVQAEGDRKLIMTLGFSHPVSVQSPEGVVFKVEKNTITVSGIDKQLVGQVAATIRAKKPPEPYKGKGIHYMGEVIRRKVGKKATATAK